ncbi:MAG: DNA-processing protein DprA [Acidimicrobiales bacterium]
MSREAMKDSDMTSAHAAALAGLPGMTPVRLASVMAGMTPMAAWEAIVEGRHVADPERRFTAAARSTEPVEVADRYLRAGVEILMPEDERYPPMLVDDPGAPAVLFAHGNPSVLHGRARVAIVGTRSATPYGRQVASELGRDLSAAGVVVVSGLARGIDGAAHAGALVPPARTSAAPVGVVGTGLDVVYPTSNAALWHHVVERGAVLSESPLGTPPHPRVFPARNRIIAALSDVVVVVESHHRGGALYTAEAAARRGIPVAAVPGSVRSHASEGTNGLLVDGCIPVRDATDVLVAISLASSGRVPPAPAQVAATLVAARGDQRPRGAKSAAGPELHNGSAAGLLTPDTAEERSVLEAVDDTPTSFETILTRTDLTIAGAAEACEQLVARGRLLCGAGWWSKT